MTTVENSRRMLTRQQLLERYPFSYTTIWGWIKAGKFPAGRRIGTGRNGTVIWSEAELDAHDANLPRQRPTGNSRTPKAA